MHTLQRTFSIVKPDAVDKGATGDIIHMLQEKGFRIIGMRMLEINITAGCLPVLCTLRVLAVEPKYSAKRT